MKKDRKWFVDKWTKERNKTDVHDPMYHFINEFISDVNQLDEPEVLSQEWIDENEEQEEMYGSYGVPVHKLQNLLVPKQEKPVIPQFIANWIESYRKKTLVELINDAVYSSDEDSKCFRRWFHEEMGFESNYSEFLSRAWLDGYEVEKEKEYYVVLPAKGEDMYLNYDVQENVNFDDYKGTRFTEAEIKSIDERYWAFAKEVTE